MQVPDAEPAGDRPPPFLFSSAESNPVRRLLLRSAERILGLARLQQIYDSRPAGCGANELLDHSLECLGVRIAAADNDLLRVPTEGPLVVVSNHPLGGLEGMVLPRLLRERRSDVKVLANYFLGRIEELQELFLLVDPFDTRESARRNLVAMRRALRWVREGGALVVFPAGEVSHLDLRTRRIADPPWNPAVAGIVRRAECPVVPVYFEGRNSVAFQLFGLLHPRLRTAMLPREMLRRSGQTLCPRIGSAISYRKLSSYDDSELTAVLRMRTYILSERIAPPVQPRVTPPGAATIVPAAPRAILTREVAGLRPDQQLVDAGDQAVYCAEPEQIPALLREIGRLREITFREAGEGTGRDLDLDEFDTRYRHLFVWDRNAREVVGAYRIGQTEELIRANGVSGLYTSTLFDFKPRLFESMGPALEMGRSFIRPEYQKSYAGMILLWKGIGHFVLRDPRCATLFGPVSISANYASASQQLIVAFLEQNRFKHEWSRWVRPHEPCRRDRAADYRSGLAHLRDLDDVSAFIGEIEADQKGVPILLKQYLRLGGRLLGFNIDPDFSNVLDVLIMVDLRRTAERTLSRYMGRDGARSFFAYHAQHIAS